MRAYKFFLPLILLSIVLLGCSEDQPMENNQVSSSPEIKLQKNAYDAIIYQELSILKQATAKYHDINKALEDGYVDINVVVPNMGHHFLNESYVDDQFELDKPELLVYSYINGKYKLVAVEFGVPLAFPTPSGFTGDEDVWTSNTGAGLWTLHAWIWAPNPDGVFAPYNSRVP